MTNDTILITNVNSITNDIVKITKDINFTCVKKKFRFN